MHVRPTRQKGDQLAQKKRGLLVWQAQADCTLYFLCAALQECGARLLVLDWKKGAAPAGLEVEGTVSTVCVICNGIVHKLCMAKHGKSHAERRGRFGRGRRGRGRSRRAVGNPLMSFQDF